MSLWRVFGKARQFTETRRAGPDALRRYQRDRLERLVAHARAHAPFYERLYRGVPESGFRLEDLPVTRKPELMEHYDEAVTDRRLRLQDIRPFAEDISNQGKLYLDEFVISNTSGTTGLRGYVAQHVTEWETFFALNALQPSPTPPRQGNLGRLLRVPFTGLRVAVVAGTGVNFITPLAFLIMPPTFRRLTRVELLSTLLPVSEMVERLNRFQPDRVHGYPTMLEALAYRQLEGDLHIRPLNISCSSEPLTPRARKALEEAFGVSVENTYGTTEAWILAKECSQGTMHLLPDGCILEAVDAEDRPVPAGSRAEKVLVTNLHNLTQPFIRYEMQDAVVPLEEAPCACGSLLPSIRLIGREDDTFFCRRPGGDYAAFPPMALESLMLETGGHRMFQMRQVERNRIRITFVPAPDQAPDVVGRRIRTRVMAYLQEHGMQDCVGLDVTAVEEVERSPRSQKTKQIASLVGPPPDLDRTRAFR